MPKDGPGARVWGGIHFETALIDQLTACHRNPENADCTLVTEKGEIPCHRIVLMGQSLTFKKMIRLMDPPQNRVVLDNFPADIVEKLLEYMYKGHIFLDLEELQDIMVVANYIQLDEFKEWVSDHVDPFLRVKDYVSWREMAERIDDPRIAMEIKRLIIKHFDEFRMTEQLLKLDAVEIGKYTKEFNFERVPKDLLVDAVLRWMNHESNTDSLDWLTAEQFDDLITRFIAQWVFERSEDAPESIRSRTYTDCRCAKGLHIDIAIQKYQDRSIHPYLLKMAHRKAEKIADERAPIQLSNPPRDNRYTLSICFNVFKKAIKEYYEQKGDDIDDRTIKEKFDILMGNRKFRMAFGPRVAELIQMKNCTREYLNGLISPQTPDEFTKLVAETEEVQGCIRNALTYMDERRRRAENWNQNSPLRLACLGGGTGMSSAVEICYMSYDGANFEEFMKLPRYIDQYSSRHSTYGNGFIATSGRNNNWITYDHITKIIKELPPCPRHRNRFAMTYYKGRIYTISGMTGQWDWKSTAECYDFEDKKWHKLPDGPEKYMTQPSAVGLGKFIYVFAKGENLFALDIETHEWQTRKKLPGSVSGGIICTDGKRIWAAGSCHTLCCTYDPETDEWEVLPRPLFKHDDPGLFWHMGLMFLAGGKDCSLVEEYDPEKNVWMESTLTLPRVTEGCSLLVLPAEDPSIMAD